MGSLKKIWPELKPYKRQIIWVIFLGILMSAAGGLVPWASNVLIDAFEHKDAQKAYLLPLVFPLIYLLLGTARFYHLSLIRFIGEQVTAQVRQRLLDQYLRLNLTFHNTYSGGSGGLISRTLNDVSVLQNGIGILANVVREPFTVIALLVYLFYTDWKLTIFIILVIPLFLVVLRQTAKSLRKYGHNNQEELEETTAILKESLDGVRVIQSFNLENEMRQRFKDNVDTYLRTRKKIIAREELSSPIIDFIASIAVLFLCLYVAHRIIGGHLTIGAFMGYLIALGLFQKPVKSVQDSFVRLQQTFVAIDRIFNILESERYVPQIANPRSFPRNWNLIRYENVSFKYNQDEVLRNINVTIHRGEVVALVGESGSGKSTFVNLLERFFDPTEGRILIDDTPINEIALEDLRANIALVTQDVFLFRDSIHNNIHAGDFYKDPRLVSEAARAANAETFIQRLPEGYQTNVGERGALLSGGERQRISIARAILKDAPILLLDEATSALDSASEVEVQKGLDHLMEGRTALVIAHRLSTIANADRILVMKNGQIIEEGPHQDLIAARGEYHRFHSLQTRS